MKTIELYYLITELTYYDENIVLIIKYYYEFELKFIEKFKEYISYRSCYLYDCHYSFLFNYNKYNGNRI